MTDEEVTLKAMWAAIVNGDASERDRLYAAYKARDVARSHAAQNAYSNTTVTELIRQPDGSYAPPKSQSN